MKVAIYTCNFGNYRNEFKNYYNIIFDKNIDYFLFTDNEINELDKWKIQKVNLLNDDEIMDKYRWTSKYIKFVLPEILNPYDIIIWIDNKMFKNKNIISKITYDNIINIINKYPEYDIFNLKHPQRKTIQEEIIKTVNLSLENKIYGLEFLNYLNNYISNFDLPDTCIIIKKNNLIVNEVFNYCFKLLKKHKLKRDQNIYNYALDTKNIIPKLLDEIIL